MCITSHAIPPKEKKTFSNKAPKKNHVVHACNTFSYHMLSRFPRPGTQPHELFRNLAESSNRNEVQDGTSANRPEKEPPRKMLDTLLSIFSDTPSGYGSFEWIHPANVPEQFASLLVHEEHLTAVLEARYACMYLSMIFLCVCSCAWTSSDRIACVYVCMYACTYACYVVRGT